jgi:hypothetical protein
MAGKCSLRDLQEHHDIDDLMDLHEVLDVEVALRARAGHSERQASR